MAGDRISLLLEGIRPTGRLSEIGPSFNPVAPRRAVEFLVRLRRGRG